MFQFAAAAAGLALLWAFLRPAADAASLITAAAASAACLLLLHRLGLIAGGGVAAPARLQLWLQGAPARIAGALQVAQAALAPQPGAGAGLVRVRTRTASPAAHAAFAEVVSAIPGLAAVDISDDALLLHALDEERVDVAALQRLEARAEAALGEGPA